MGKTPPIKVVIKLLPKACSLPTPMYLRAQWVAVAQLVP